MTMFLKIILDFFCEMVVVQLKIQDKYKIQTIMLGEKVLQILLMSNIIKWHFK